MTKKISAVILTGALLMQLLIITVFAADVTLMLSKQSSYSGDNITASGTYDPEEWITVKAIDADGNIVFIEPVLSEGDGTFSTTLIVPDIDAGTLTITAGSGSNAASAEFTVKQRTYYYDDNNDGDEEEGSKAVGITTPDGKTITGAVKETEDGYDVTINGDDFSRVTGDSVKIATQFVEVTFDQTAAEFISDTAGSGSIVLSIVNTDTSSLSDEARELIGDRPAYEFKLNAGGNDLSSFGGGLAHVSIPYTPVGDEDLNRIVIYYITDNGELIVMTDSTYDGTSINTGFSTGHFSIYAVGYNYVAFDDVLKDAWYYDAVIFCAAREITNGTGDDMFSPDTHLTRGQFIVMLMRAFAIGTDKSAVDNFDDAGDTYYTDYLAAAKSLGITDGIGNNLFAPEAEITRQDMFTLLYRTLDALEELPEMVGNISLSDFSDSVAISDYAKQAMEAFVSSGIISGNDGDLDPLGNSTRAQMAQVLYNLLGL